jgi:hypothetical protein
MGILACTPALAFLYYFNLPDCIKCAHFTNPLDSVSQDHSIASLKHVPMSFLQWFVGFFDAEGSFSIIVNGKYVSFTVRIRLHKDDIATLYEIQSKLGVGSVWLEGDTAVYQIKSFEDIKNVIIPLFDLIPLLTTKVLDYHDFKAAVMLKGNTVVL